MSMIFDLFVNLRFQRAARMREAGKQNKSPAKLVATFGQPHEDGLDGSSVAPRSSFHPFFFHSPLPAIPGGESDCEEPEIEDDSGAGESLDSDLELKLHIMGSKMLWTQNRPQFI